MLKQFFAAVAILVAALFGSHTPPHTATTAQLPPHATSAAPASHQPATTLSFASSFHPQFPATAAQQNSPSVKSTQSIQRGAALGTVAVPKTATNVSTNAGEVLGASVSSTDTVTQGELEAALNALRSQFFSASPAALSFSGPAASTPASFAAVALSQQIDNLANVTISNATVHGVAGLTAADIPTGIVASNYLPLTGGALTGTLSGTNLTLSGNLTVSGAQTLSGAITVPSLSATSTTATSSFAGGFSVTGYSSLATTTITGGLTVNGNTNITQGGELTVGDKVIAPGEIGLGTTSPYAKLSVQSTDANQTVLALVGTSTQTNPYLDIFSNTGSNLFRISAAGNVGIGTSSPGSLLSLGGIANFTTATSTFYSTGGLNLAAGCFATAGNCLSLGTLGGTLAVGQGGTGSTTLGGLLTGNGTGAVNSAAVTSPLTFSGNTLSISQASSAQGGYLAAADWTSFNNKVSSSSLTSIFPFTPTSNFGAAANSTSTPIWFQSGLQASSTSQLANANFSGNVGIGTTSPAGALDVAVSNGSDALTVINAGSTNKAWTLYPAGNDLRLFEFTGGETGGGNVRVTFQAGGKVGIGTTSPAQELVLSGNSSQYSTIAALGLYDTNSGARNWGIYNGNGNSGSLNFKVSSTNGGNPDSGTITLDLESSGNVGIGTTSPWRTLDVNGTVGFKGLTNDTADQKTLCLTANNEVVSNSGTSCITSSQRFKNSITPLATTSGLAEVLQLAPVSFRYNDAVGIPGMQVGFIAEQVNTVDARLVVFDASNTPFSVKYENLTAILAKAIQEIAGISGAFKANLIAWLGDAGNGIGNLFAQTITATNVTADTGTFQKLCVGSTCVTPAQFQAMVAAAAGQSPAASPSSSASAASSDTASGTPPIIVIAGANPATIHVGDSYADLGATITGPTDADKNLGLKYFLNGTLVSDIVIDTSQVATDTIDYVATDPTGLTATSTRSVIIEASAAPSIVPDYNASTTIPASPIATTSPTVEEASTSLPADGAATATN